MSALKDYFIRRVGKPLAWEFKDAPGRWGVPDGRAYEIVTRGVDGATLIATVKSHDLDGQGMRTTRVPNDHGPVRVDLRGLETAVEALEDAARAADKKFFAGLPVPVRGGAEAHGAVVEERLRALASPQGREEGMPPPAPASVARFRKFWTETPDLLAPELFSSKDGTIRARWQDGHERTLWINFPEKGPLGWSASVPRSGGYGLRRLNARCNDDQDIVHFVAAVGVRCTR